jgi:hypothetical protein
VWLPAHPMTISELCARRIAGAATTPIAPTAVDLRSLRRVSPSFFELAIIHLFLSKHWADL